MNKLSLENDKKCELQLAELRLKQEEMQKLIERQGIDIAQEITLFEGKLKEIQTQIEIIPKLEKNQENIMKDLINFSHQKSITDQSSLSNRVFFNEYLCNHRMKLEDLLVLQN